MADPPASAADLLGPLLDSLRRHTPDRHHPEGEPAMPMTRAQHVDWTRKRALAELDAGGPDAITNALASVWSDLGKHPQTQDHAAIELGGMLAIGGHLQSPREVREFIDGIR